MVRKMIITYNKNYSESTFKHFSLFGMPSHKDTLVMDEYYHLLYVAGLKGKSWEGLLLFVKEYIPKSKARINIQYCADRIEFLKPNKIIFPVFYVTKA